MLIFVIVFIGLSFLILAHEAAHFLCARMFKLKVDEFGFGFPPRIFAWRPFNKAQGKKGETEYSVNWLPFGGFVRIAGEHDSFNDTQNNPEPGRTGDHLGDGSPGIVRSDEEKKRFFSSQPPWRRSVIILAGVVANFLIGWMFLSIVFMVGTPPAIVIGGTQSGSPAAEAGIQEGDLIKSYRAAGSVVQENGISSEETRPQVSSEAAGAGAFKQFIDEHLGEPVELKIIRGGKNVVLTLTPRVDAPPGEGALGILFADIGRPRYSFFPAILEGLTASFGVAWLTLVTFYKLILTLVSQGALLEGVVGPVGIFTFAEQTSHIGLIYLLQLLSVISINLAVINLIPFPALDGGRFFMILFEKMRGAPLSSRVESVINTIGFVFLIFLMAVLTLRDIINL